MQANNDLYIKILPYMEKEDSEWGVVTSKIFNTGKFKALETYGYAIRNYLVGKAIDKAIIDAEAAVEPEQEEDDDFVYMTEESSDEKEDS
jgi:hypothetical protein